MEQKKGDETMKVKYNATIKYRMLSTHPDIECVSEWSRDKEFEYRDVYTMDMDYFDSKEEAIDYIKYDLRLVAGGGYNSDHIWNEKFEIRRIA